MEQCEVNRRNKLNKKRKDCYLYFQGKYSVKFDILRLFAFCEGNRIVIILLCNQVERMIHYS